MLPPTGCAPDPCGQVPSGWPSGKAFCGRRGLARSALCPEPQGGGSLPWTSWRPLGATCGSTWTKPSLGDSACQQCFCAGGEPAEGIGRESHDSRALLCDFDTFKGEAMQQPRRLRAMVAHVRVTLGHLSNDRLAGMLSGAQESVVQLARGLRCQVCAAARPPQATPQVAYMKPKQFNERVSGDSFHIWGHKGDKYVVTQFGVLHAVVPWTL